VSEVTGSFSKNKSPKSKASSGGLRVFDSR
jgi:hypothetical protein